MCFKTKGISNNCCLLRAFRIPAPSRHFPHSTFTVISGRYLRLDPLGSGPWKKNAGHLSGKGSQEMPVGSGEGRPGREGRQPIRCQRGRCHGDSWSWVLLGALGSGQACTQDTSNEGAGTWASETSTPGCHWLVVTLGQQPIIFGGALILQHGTPILFCENKHNFICL